MNITTHNKQEIAIQHLNLALSEYTKSNNLYSVIHLAGAAEEMLGTIVKIHKKQKALERAVDWMQSWRKIIGKENKRKDDAKHILKVKNGVKHLDGKKDMELTADIGYECKEIIRRALENFNQLQIQITPEILAYYQHERNNRS